MKTLLIDAGNTRVKFGWVDTTTGEREPAALAIGHDSLAQLDAWLRNLAPEITRAIGTNVAGQQAANRIHAALHALAAPAPQWISSQAETAGVRNTYDHPAQLGADRWLAMVGMVAHAQGTRPLMLANFGTTTTIDTLAYGDTGTPVFAGGLIMPGPELMRASLKAATANLPLAEGPAAAFPQHTHQAISSGIAAAQTGALLRQWREGLARYGQAPQVFCSGGGWHLVEPEAARVLARAQADMGLEVEEINWLATPVLDGLARLAASGA
ncbi:type III pantothenate kinase [Pusillimonas sp. TS35]|uniref:type III pantothenate kinase n=1 Tax=Paracandidimonas lactea TaxID=2895524 RepID=UPI001368ACC9|nr:type III pantothenate kinase [Paracandidimonas lactea]MYN13976.1 type III pantothenate kinase [Pusillimonas sp. TS35]